MGLFSSSDECTTHHYPDRDPLYREWRVHSLGTVVEVAAKYYLPCQHEGCDETKLEHGTSRKVHKDAVLALVIWDEFDDLVDALGNAWRGEDVSIEVDYDE